MGATKERKEPQAQRGSSAFLDQAAVFVEEHLDRILPSEVQPPRILHRAMRYSIFAGGKRLRPALVLAAAQSVGGELHDAAPAACAVEMVHTYSLIHDDLPAMDDDDLRRGRPTCHKAFGAAIAILAGDALLTLAFETLTCTRRARIVPALVRALATGAGTQGMVGGQVLDLEGEGRKPEIAAVRAIHRWKTAALIAAACEMGALAGGGTLIKCEHMARFGKKIGLAFQIFDDILDETGSPGKLGKTPGKDKKAGKATYPAALGLKAAREEAESVVAEAMGELRPFGARARELKSLAWYVIERTH